MAGFAPIVLTTPLFLADLAPAVGGLCMPQFRFGSFELNEELRALRCGGADLPVQPLVFDLLAYLLRNQGRVVGKDELLDRLWPGVSVTEGSLQRAVSLARSALRQGGLENAIRSYPKRGYRFLADPEGWTDPDAAKAATAATSPVERARARYAQWDWAGTIAAFREADAADQMQAADLEMLAAALECSGEPSEAIKPLTRAVVAYSMGGRSAEAAIAAINLCKLHMNRGETAVAKGWLKRADGLIGADHEAREFGFLLWMQSRLCTAEGQNERALQLVEQAYAVARARDDQELEALSLMYRGFLRVILGQTRIGIEDQDHAATLALSPALNPIHRSTMYCVILWTCRNMGDWTRATQWTLEYQRWAQFRRMTYSGACQLHRAEVLSVQGTLREAEARIGDALERLPVDEPWALGDGLRVIGDVYAALGEEEKALRAYEQAYEVGWDPQPGYALLMLERGDSDAALRALERALAEPGWVSLQRQGLLLAHLALVAAKAGETKRAADAIAGVEREPERWPAPSIQALLAQARAEMLRARGDLAAAMREMQRARMLWSEAESPVSVAETRLDIADLLLELGDLAGAELEGKTACAAANRLESPKLIQRCDDLRRALFERHHAPQD